MRLRSRVIRTLQAIRARVSHWRLTASDGSSLAVFGSPSAMHNYRGEFFGSDEGRVQCERVVDWAGWGAAVAREREACALVVINGCRPPPEQRANAIACPRFFQMAIPLPDSLEAYRRSLGSDALRDLRRLRSSQLIPRITQDAEWEADFWETYHHPSMILGYGASGVLESRRLMQSTLLDGTGEFVQVLRGEACIAANFCVRQGSTYFARSLGWLRGEDGPIRLGAIGALYWFVVERAMQLGCTTVRLGGVPPNLSNGLLQFKAKWGATFVPEWSHSPVDHLLLNPRLPGWRRFMEGHDLVAWGPDRTLEVHSIRAPEEIKVRPHVKAAIARWHRIGIPVDAGP